MNDDLREIKYKNVMVIDDTFTDRYIAEHFLKRLSARVISLESASAALKYLTEFADRPEELPQLIFVDIRMPGMDGFEFLHEYEKLPSLVHQSCNIIMISSTIDPEDHERIKNNPLVGRFISKPLNKEVLNTL